MWQVIGSRRTAVPISAVAPVLALEEPPDALAMSVSMSLKRVLRWPYWWNSTEEWPDDVTKDQVSIELNTDSSTEG